MLVYRPTTQNLLGGLPFRQGTDSSPDTIIFTALLLNYLRNNAALVLNLLLIID